MKTTLAAALTLAALGTGTAMADAMFDNPTAVAVASMIHTTTCQDATDALSSVNDLVVQTEQQRATAVALAGFVGGASAALGEDQMGYLVSFCLRSPETRVAIAMRAVALAHARRN